MRYKHRGHMHIPTTGAALRPEKLETLLYGEPVSVTVMKAQHAEQEKERSMRATFKHQQELAKQALHIQKKEEEAMTSLRESLEQAIAEKEARAAKLQATLDDWGDEEPVNEKPTTKENTVTTIAPAPIKLSVSQQTFEFIKANSGISTKKAIKALVERGLNESSVTSLISQMIRKGMVSKVGHCLHAQVTYYRTPGAVKKAKPALEHKQVRITVEGKDINPPSGGIAALSSKPDVAYNITSLLDNISVNEARALYIELKKLFGGN